MPRKRQHIPLRVLLNNRLVGHLLKEPSGAVSFRYVESWLSANDAIPLSLSLPLREDAYRGERVVAVCENLLPDSETLRRRIAERIGAKGADAYSLLSRIGRDCVGALQFVPDDDDAVYDTSRIDGEVVGEHEVERLLKNLVRTPLGLDMDEEFRISIAGAQEKTALLRHKGKWLKPHGTTPTTHILKAQILFWLLGATDGHAKNFSVFLGAGGRFQMTPLYDVLTAQPSLDGRQIQRKQMKLAMSVGDSRHYRMDEIKGRHFVQTAERASLPGSLAREVLAEVAGAADTAMNTIEKQLPSGFPEEIHLSVKRALTTRLKCV
jgi:HipA-like protein